MSETASAFVDPVFLARFGLNRANVLDYFLHPLNPFRTKVNTSNEVLAMQGIGIGMYMQMGVGNGIPMSPQAAEEEYTNALAQMTGEQYDLLIPPHARNDPHWFTLPSPLFTIRHVLRTNPTSVKVLGIYYVVEGVIYKAPSVRSLMKANVTRVLDGLMGATEALSVCARFQPSTGYTWHFEATTSSENKRKQEDSQQHDDEEELDPVGWTKLARRHKRRKVLDHRPPGERTQAEEEGIRAAEAMDRILVRLSTSLKKQMASSAASTVKKSPAKNTPTSRTVSPQK